MLSAMTLDQLSAKMRCENRRLNLVQPKLRQLRSQGSPLQRRLKRPEENATDDAVLWGVSDHIVPHLPTRFAGGFCGVNFGRLGFCRKVGALLFDLARRNKAAGLETTAACNRCDAVLRSRAWRSELCVDRLACLAGANDVRSPVAVCRTTIQPDDRKLARSIMLIKTALLSKLSIAIRAVAVPVPY